MSEEKKSPRDDPEESKRFIETAKRIGVTENDAPFLAAVGVVRAAPAKMAPAKNAGAKVKSAKRKR